MPSTQQPTYHLDPKLDDLRAFLRERRALRQQTAEELAANGEPETERMLLDALDREAEEAPDDPGDDPADRDEVQP